MSRLIRALFYSASSSSLNNKSSHQIASTAFRSYSSQSRYVSTATHNVYNSHSNPVYRPRRALLYVPGSSQKMLSKASSLSADSLCLDLEDSVTPQQKSEARNNIVQTLLNNNVDRNKTELLVRINSVGSGFELDDISTILCPEVVNNKNTAVLPDGFVLPKVEKPEDLLWLTNQISRLTNPLMSHRFTILAGIETISAMFCLRKIFTATPSLRAVIFGGDDYSASIGGVRTETNAEINFPRNWVLMHAKAAGLQAIDIVTIDFNNSIRLLRECKEGYEMGYTGKQCIHPKQLEIIQNSFAPSKESIDYAVELLKATENSYNSGAGAFAFKGQMIDLPTIKAAQNVVQRAKACGLI